MSAGLATLLFLQANTVFAANLGDISVFPDPFLAFGVKSYIDYSGDWRPYCSPGPTNYVRWYTGNDLLQSAQPGFDCAVGTALAPSATIPGSISLWNYGAGILPASLPHSPLQRFFGANGDFYFTLTSNFSNYSTSTTNPIGISILTDPAWDGAYSPYSISDLTTGWIPYCTPGATNNIRWYTSDGTLRSMQIGLDCAIGMSNSTGNVPGTVNVWNFGGNILPSSLPHNSGNIFGQDGDFYFTLTNGDGTVYRYDYGWHTDTKVNRFDWSWNGSDYVFPQGPTSTPQYCVPGDTPDCNSNVMFLPGIEGSRLYAPGSISAENQIWEPNRLGDDISSLDLNNYQAFDQVYTKEKEILRNAYNIYPIYRLLTNQMNDLVVNSKISDWLPIAYDWRLDYEDLLTHGNYTDGKIYYRGSHAATSTPYIVQELKRLATSSKSGKVTLIAHSNGGLLAKALLSHPEYTQYVDKLILVASPQLGTPQAIGALLHGTGQALPKEMLPIFLSDADARYLGQNMPMAYNLLPSAAYFQYSQNPAIKFDAITLQDWAQKYGESVTSQNQLRAFMTDLNRTAPAYTDLVTPAVVQGSLYENSVAVHDELDNWTPPDGVEVITIAGWGDETLSSIEYKKVPSLICVIRAADGSCASNGFGTILTISPKFVIDGDGTVVESSAQWSNGASISRYWINLLALNAGENGDFGHANIFESAPVLELLQSLITNQISLSLPLYVSTAKPIYDGSASRLYFTLHSPLALGFVDQNGSYSGASSTSALFDIPSVEYRRLGEVQWLSIPKSLVGQIVMRGTGSGSFTLDIEEVNGNETTSTTTFAAIPSSTSTIATIDIDPNSSPTSNAILKVDFNGDGTIDRVLSAKQGNIVLPDIIPPEVVVSVSTSSRDISVVGVDDVSPTTSVIKTATTTTAIDTSGNKTSLYFQKTFNGNILTYARLTGINYGTSTIPLGASFLYVWDSTKTLVSQTVIVDNNFGIEALYDKKKDRTTFLVKKKGTSFQTVNLSGLRLVKLATNKGSINYSW